MASQPSKSTAPEWRYLSKKSDRRIYCKECDKNCGTSVTRARDHLLGIVGGLGGGVKGCEKIKPEVRENLRAEIESYKKVSESRATKKRKVQDALLGRETISTPPTTSMTPPTSSMPYGSQREPTLPDPDETQQTLTKTWKSLERNEVDDSVYDFFIGCNISFNTIRSHLFRDMIKKATQFGPTYKPPSYNTLRTKGVERSKARMEERIKPIKDSWEVTGCSLVSDGWTDRQSRPLVNTLACCPRGVIHLSTIDCMNKTKTAEYLFEILKDTILSIGEDKVVQVVTDNASNCVRAGELLMEHFPKLFWTPCAAHCLDLALHDIGKIPWVQENINLARKTIKFILNHRLTLSIFRNFATKNLLRPGETRFATHYIALKRLVEQRNAMRSLVCNEEWMNNNLAKSKHGKMLENTVFNHSFWESAEKILSICEPIVKVLRIVDSDAACMGFVYECMDRTKEHIAAACDHDHDQYKPIWDIVDHRWTMLHRPLHAAGVFLAPNYFHVHKDADIMDGFYTCVERMYPDPEVQKKIRLQSLTYMNGSNHSFTTTRATGDMACIDNTPAEWWMMHGYETPELKQLAIRVLSQVSSASACERSWSTHEFIHSKKRNKLSAEKLADLANIHCNLHLWLRSLEGNTSSSKKVREVPPGISTSYDVGSSSRGVEDVSTSTHGLDDEDDNELLRDEGVDSDEAENFSYDSGEDGLSP